MTQVLHKLKKQGVQLKEAKCAFFKKEVEYLGYWIDANGVHIAPFKLQVIEQAPSPRNITELRAFLGLLNYHGKFIPNLSTLIHSLNALLRQGAK